MDKIMNLEERLIVTNIHFSLDIEAYIATTIHDHVIVIDPLEYEPLNISYEGMPVYVMKKDVHQEYMRIHMEAMKLYREGEK